MYTRSVTLRRACVVKKSVRVGCGKKGFEPSFFFEEKSWKIRAKETADLSRFLSSINCPYILRKKRRGGGRGNGAFRNLVVHAALRLTRNIR